MRSSYARSCIAEVEYPLADLGTALIRNGANFTFIGFSEVELPLYGVLRSSQQHRTTLSGILVA
jgi:hypothetical protein